MYVPQLRISVHWLQHVITQLFCLKIYNYVNKYILNVIAKKLYSGDTKGHGKESKNKRRIIVALCNIEYIATILDHFCSHQKWIKHISNESTHLHTPILSIVVQSWLVTICFHV